MLVIEVKALVGKPDKSAVVAVAWVSFGPHRAGLVMMIHASDTALGALCGIARQAKEWSRATAVARN